MTTELTVTLEDAPGTLASLGCALGAAGINIDSVHVTIRGHVVLGVDDLDGATQVARGDGGDDARLRHDDRWPRARPYQGPITEGGAER